MEPLANSIRSRAELVEYLTSLAATIASGETRVDNHTVASFVEAAAGWLGDLDGWCANRGEAPPKDPSWALIASIVSAGLVYE